MEVKLMVHSKELSSEELLALLQAVRDCEMRHFKKKTIGIWIDAPQLSAAEAKNILGKVQPPFAKHWELPTQPPAKVLNLGKRMILVGNRTLGTCDEVALSIAEATGEEIRELEAAHVIGLVRMAQG